MINLAENKEECCGCNACYNICPKNAIEIKEDKYGFTYPYINKELCIKCRLCENVCDFKTQKTQKSKAINVYAAIHKDEKILCNSSSGGVFSAIAEYVLKLEGIVFGCYLNEEFLAEHIYIENLKDLHKLQGSKYVQSNTKKSFKECKCFLNENKIVLFSGTPCQIAGLKLFLGKEYSNLITVDLICHGVPNNKFLKEYIRVIEKNNNMNIKKIKFRDKSEGWKSLGKIEYIKNKKEKIKKIYPIESSYYHHFYNSNICRDSCYKCIYAISKRVGDFTLGDYWGVEKLHPEINKANGVSLVLINTKKASLITDKALKNKINLIETNLEFAISNNTQLKTATKPIGNRIEILNEFEKYGFEYIDKKYNSKMKYNIYIYKLKKFIKNILNL